MSETVGALTRAFAQVVADLEQDGVDRKAIAAHLDVEPSTISRYATGERSVPLEKLPLIDQLAGQPIGHVLRIAGYVHDGGVDVKAAIEADPSLTNRLDKDAMRALYNVFRRRSAASNTVSDAPASKAKKASSSASR